MVRGAGEASVEDQENADRARLAANLGMVMPIESTAEGTDHPAKRRGRPPKSPQE